MTSIGMLSICFVNSLKLKSTKVGLDLRQKKVNKASHNTQLPRGKLQNRGYLLNM